MAVVLTRVLRLSPGPQSGPEPLVVVKLPEARRGFVLLTRRWVVERSFGWMARFRRPARDHERLSETLEGLHSVASSLVCSPKAGPPEMGVPR